MTEAGALPRDPPPSARDKLSPDALDHAADRPPESARGPRPTGEEKVTNRRPPVATRFRPGQSGNPRGRPKRARALAEIVARELGEIIEAKENGERTRLTKLEATVKQYVNRAVNGDQRAAQFVLSLVRDDQHRSLASPPSPATLSEGDELVAAELVRRLSRPPE